MQKVNKRGAMGLDMVPSVAITLVVVAVVFVVFYLILAGIQTNVTSGGVIQSTNAYYNTTLGSIGNMTSAGNNIITFAPTWGTVIGASVMLLIVVGGLYWFINKRSGGL